MKFPEFCGLEERHSEQDRKKKEKDSSISNRVKIS